MARIIGFWCSDNKTRKWDRSIDESPYYVIDKSVELEDGEYVFDIIKSIRTKRGEPINFLSPVIPIVKKSRNDVFRYAYSDLHQHMKRLFRLAEYPEDINVFEYYSIHYAMRVMRNLGYDWVPENHNDESRKAFISLIHDKILNGELNIYQMYMDHVEEIEEIGGSSYIIEISDPFSKNLPFDPNYDKLVPEFIPSRNSNSVTFRSSDISSYMSRITIYDTDSYKCYEKYFHPDVDIIMKPTMVNGIRRYNITLGYKLPEKGSGLYQNMIEDTNIHSLSLGITGVRNSVRILVPSIQHPKVYREMEISDEFYKEVFEDVLKEHHMRHDVRGKETFITCDEDYQILRLDECVEYSPNEYVHVKFSSGNTGFFKAVEIFSKMKGKCINADMKKTGNTLQTLKIIFTQK